MYNQEIKEKFIKETTVNWVSVSSLEATFKNIGVIENKKQMDFAQMQYADAVEALCNAGSMTYLSCMTLLTSARRYIKWCSKNDVFDNVSQAIKEISVDDIDISHIMAGLIFKDEDSFVHATRSMRPFDEGYYEVAVFALIWLGLDLQQIIDLKISDVDFENRVVFINGRVFATMSDATYNILYTYNRTKSASRDSKYKPRTVYRDDSFDKFIRKFAAPTQLGVKPLEKPQVRTAINEINNEYKEKGNEPQFTPSNISISGGLRRVFELEESGVDVFQVRNKELVINAYRAEAKLYEILWMYRNYKRAISL